MTEISTHAWLKSELQKVHSIVVYINTSVPGLMAPKNLMAKPSFTLQLSNNFDRALIFQEEAIRSEFLFETGFEPCLVPFKSIWAAHPFGESEKIVFWNENSPGEGWDTSLLDFLKIEKMTAKTTLQVLPAAKSAKQKDSSDLQSQAKNKNRPQLKLIK